MSIRHTAFYQHRRLTTPTETGGEDFCELISTRNFDKKNNRNEVTVIITMLK
jgi:hypothetical protein